MADGKTELLAPDRLRAGVVRIVEVEGAAGKLELDGREFDDGGALRVYLASQSRSRFADGILVAFADKEATADLLYRDIIRFCVENDVDLFATARVSKVGPANVVWVVQSTVSPYLPSP